MKAVVLSAMICAASMANSVANVNMGGLKDKRGNSKELSYDQKKVDRFKDDIAFHQRNVEVLWEQYDMAVARIVDSRGNHQELDADKAYFVGVCQEDIAKGLRVEDSKRTISEIEAIYAQKHADRDAYEAKAIAKVQAQLKAELGMEKESFRALKKAYGHLVNDQTLPLLLEAEHSFAKSNDMIARMNDTATGFSIAGL